MPRRATPGNRERIEAALGPVLRSALWLVCQTLGVPPDRWQDVPPLEALVTTVAVVRLAAELDESSTRRAVERAAFRLQVPPDTILNRLRRWNSL